jgi:hypothetical protein
VSKRGTLNGKTKTPFKKEGTEKEEGTGRRR